MDQPLRLQMLQSICHPAGADLQRLTKFTGSGAVMTQRQVGEQCAFPPGGQLGVLVFGQLPQFAHQPDQLLGLCLPRHMGHLTIWFIV